MTVNASNILHAPGTISANADSVQGTYFTNNAVVIRVTGTWVGTLKVKSSPDGGTTFDSAPIRVINLSKNNNTQTSITENGTYLVPFVHRLPAQGVGNGAYDVFAVLATAWTSGTATLQASSFHANVALSLSKQFEPDLENGTVVVSASQVTSLQTLVSEKPQIRFYVLTDGNPVFVKFGTANTVVADPTQGNGTGYHLVIEPGIAEIFTVPYGCLYMSVICEAGKTATLRYLPGEGN